MKIAPLYHALAKETWAHPQIVHTGQHYDLNMSDAFFVDLKLPEPHIHLNVGSGSHAEQTGRVMIAYEKVILETQPDLIVVVGDVNSTLACTLAAVKVVYSRPKLKDMQRPLVAHLEAGLRSFDRTMPEEINRIATDALADIDWTPSPDGDDNLIKEGVPKHKIKRVGNIMIDSLEMMRENIEKQNAYLDFGMSEGSYGVVTLHRPANVDNYERLSALCSSLISISRRIPLIFSVHPRTQKNLIKYELMSKLKETDNIFISEPMNYIRFMNLVFNCQLVITDSGGIQEETTYLGIPCLTMRPNTERPVTITSGTNRLCSLSNIENMVDIVLSEKTDGHITPDMWDGKTAARIVECIKTI